MNPPNNIAIKGLLPPEALDKISIVKLISQKIIKFIFLHLNAKLLKCVCACKKYLSTSFSTFFRG